MAGIILENLSTKKVVVICIFLLGLSLSCFIMGGVKVPRSVHTQTAIGNWCKQKFVTGADGKQKEVEWYASRAPPDEKCEEFAGMDDPRIKTVTASQIVFSFQYPLPRDNKELTMDRMFMYHVTVLSFNILHQKANLPGENALISMPVKVGFKDGNDTEWNPLLDGVVERRLKCDHDQALTMKEGDQWNCDFLDLFEIGNMHHQKYLVNIRLPPNQVTGHNIKLGNLAGVDLVWFAQTGGFTVYFLAMKTVCFAMVLPLTIWNWKRVIDLNRSPVFLERLLLGLAVSAITLNLPIDWLVLVTKMEFMLLWSDIRQGIFLSVLLTYWLVFTGEHMMDDVKRGKWSDYWKQLTTVILASSLMFIFDICERGVRIADPFFSLWSTSRGATVGKAFIGIALAAGILYCLILLTFIAKAIYNIWKKKSRLKSSAQGLRIHYMSIVYRFFFMLLFSAVCSMLTVTAFGMGQIYESRWKWDFDDEEYDVEEGDTNAKDQGGKWSDSMKQFEINTAFQLGVYGTWNVYVMAMLIFYAPSHKRSNLGVSVVDDDVNEEEVELTAISAEVRPRNRSAGSIPLSDEVTDETVNLTTGHSITKEGISHIHTLSGESMVE